MINYSNATFVKSASKKSEAPGKKLPEVLLCGRSNVGKSSFINALCNKKKLAYTSSKPGHTRLLNYYEIDESFYLRSPFELSGGEKRRVAIAGILAIEPDILVLDEPTAGLDPVGVSDIMSIVKKMHEDGKTIILVTHDMDLVMKYCEKVYVLNKGKLAFQGNPYQLFAEDNETLGIEVPALFELARKLKNKGLKIDVESIRNVDDFIKQYLEAKK